MTLKISTTTLDDLQQFSEIRELVEKLVALVSAKAKLCDAKREMEKVKNCQGVFFTENGKREKPVIGWLPNTEISKHTRT